MVKEKKNNQRARLSFYLNISSLMHFHHHAMDRSLSVESSVFSIKWFKIPFLERKRMYNLVIVTAVRQGFRRETNTSNQSLEKSSMVVGLSVLRGQVCRVKASWCHLMVGENCPYLSSLPHQTGAQVSRYERHHPYFAMHKIGTKDVYGKRSLQWECSRSNVHDPSFCESKSI